MHVTPLIIKEYTAGRNNAVCPTQDDELKGDSQDPGCRAHHCTPLRRLQGPSATHAEHPRHVSPADLSAVHPKRYLSGSEAKSSP